MRIVIVDAFSTGAIFADHLARTGVSCVHVQSSKDLDPYLARTFQPASFTEDLGYYDSYTDLVTELTRSRATAVVAGAESGVLLADSLASSLGTPGNGVPLSPARRDKGLMVGAWLKAGVRVPVTVRVSRVDQIPGATARGQVVVKPLDSAGSDNVHFCSGMPQIRDAVGQVLSSSNFLGNPNTAALIQERIIGRESYVNTVSVDGRHQIVEIWQYTKTEVDGHPVYDYEEPHPVPSAPGTPFGTFVRHALDALGIRTGATHLELIIDDRGPVAIECGARLAGGVHPDALARIFGTSTMHVLAHTLRGHDVDAGAAPATSATRKAVRYVSLINRIAGTVNDYWRERVQALPTCFEIVSSKRAGEAITTTTKLASSPGFVYLVGGTPQEVERDYEQLRAWEHDGLYT